MVSGKRERELVDHLGVCLLVRPGESFHVHPRGSSDYVLPRVFDEYSSSTGLSSDQGAHVVFVQIGGGTDVISVQNQVDLLVTRRLTGDHLEESYIAPSPDPGWYDSSPNVSSRWRKDFQRTLQSVLRDGRP